MKPQTFSGQNQLQLQVRRPEGERGRRAEALDGGQWGTWAVAAGLARGTGRSSRWLRATASGEDIWEPVLHPHLCEVPCWGTSHGGRAGPCPGTSSTQPLDPPISPGRGPASPPTHTGSLLFVPLKCKLNSTWETACCRLPANLVPQRHFGTFLENKWEPRGGGWGHCVRSREHTLRCSFHG